MIIGLANSKGGVGKSCLAKNLVVYLNDQYGPTALVDAERNGPTAQILRQFDSKIVTRSASTLAEIDDAVAELTQAGNHVVIDAPGKEGAQVSTLCLLSDLVIIPTCIAEQDILQTGDILTLVRHVQRRGEGKPKAVIVFTRTIKNDVAAPILRKQLSPLGIPIAETQVRERVAIKRNACVMRDAQFFENDGPANDFVNLIREVIDPLLADTSKKAFNE